MSQIAERIINKPLLTRRDHRPFNLLATILLITVIACGKGIESTATATPREIPLNNPPTNICVIAGEDYVLGGIDAWVELQRRLEQHVHGAHLQTVNFYDGAGLKATKKQLHSD